MSCHTESEAWSDTLLAEVMKSGRSSAARGFESDLEHENVLAPANADSHHLSRHRLSCEGHVVTDGLDRFPVPGDCEVYPEIFYLLFQL